MDDPGSPGSHGRNWSPAETIEDYVRNCKEGLEEYSDRRAAKLLGWSRMQVYRAKLMAELPRELFERLLAADITSSKALAQVMLAINRGDPRSCDVERCPHCGGVLRVRAHLPRKVLNVIREWLAG